MRQDIKLFIMGLYLVSFTFVVPEVIWCVQLVSILLSIVLLPYYLESIKKACKQLIFYAIIPIVAGLYAAGHDGRDVVRDIWLLTLPFLPFILGWLFSLEMNIRSMVRVLFTVSIALSSYSLLNILLNWSRAIGLDQSAYRQEMGYVDVIVVYGCVMAVDSIINRSKFKIAEMQLEIATLIISLTAIVFSFARTSYTILGIGLLFVIIPSVIPKYKMMYWLALVGITVCLLVMGGLLEDTAPDTTTFGGRMSSSILELTETDFDTMEAVSSRFRAYESLMAMQAYLDGNPIQLAVGQGLGALVDLQVEMNLTSAQLELPPVRYIPVLHNGYTYLLIKSGILGIGLFFAQFVFLWRIFWVRNAGPEIRPIVNIGRVILLATLFSTYVIRGPYNAQGWFGTMLLLGFAVGALSHFKVSAPMELRCEYAKT